MAAALENTGKIIIHVKLLSGDIFDIELFDTDLVNSENINSIIKHKLRKLNQKIFPYSSDIRIHKITNSNHIEHDDYFMAYIKPKSTKQIVHYINCQPFKETGVTYQFELDKKEGVQISAMRSVSDGIYKPNQIKEYINDSSKPNFTLFVSYDPVRESYLVHETKPNGFYEHEWGSDKTYQYQNKNETETEFFKSKFIYVYEDEDSLIRDINYIHFKIKSAAVKQLIELLKEFNGKCPPINSTTNGAVASLAALSLNNQKQEGGKRKKRKTMKKRYKKGRKQTNKYVRK